MKKAFLCTALIFIILLSGCARQKPLSRTEFLFDTVTTVTLYEGGSENTLEKCFSELKKLDGAFSIQNPNSELYALNKNGSCALSEESFSLISRALSLSAQTGGAFDPTLGTVSGLYSFKEGAVPPENDAVSAALLKSGVQNIELLEGGKATLQNGTLVDLGGIAKGYASKKLREILISDGVRAGIIDLGGNIVVVGEKNPPFRIGIKKPFSESGELFCTLTPGEKAVVTAGIYERCFTYNGTLYHHILDPKTGFPAGNSTASVTIVSDDPTLADALSTAALVAGREAGLSLVGSFEGTEALFIFRDGSSAETAGFSQYYAK